jgi:hypothetical protein
MIKKSRSRPGSDWPRSTEDSAHQRLRRGKSVPRRALVELGGYVEAVHLQRITDSPCTPNLGRGGGDSVNFSFNLAHWWSCECLIVVHGAIYRHNGPADDPRPRNTSLVHGYHVRKRHSEGGARREWHGGGMTKPWWTPLKYPGPALARLVEPWHDSRLSPRGRSLPQITRTHPVLQCLGSLSAFFRYFQCSNL